MPHGPHCILAESPHSVPLWPPTADNIDLLCLIRLDRVSFTENWVGPWYMRYFLWLSRQPYSDLYSENLAFLTFIVSDYNVRHWSLSYVGHMLYYAVREIMIHGTHCRKCPLKIRFLRLLVLNYIRTGDCSVKYHEVDVLFDPHAPRTSVSSPLYVMST